MANWFETITKTLADDRLSRRQAVKKAAGVTAATVVAAIIPTSNAFTAIFDSGHTCKRYGNCSSDFMGCEYRKYHNPACICFQKLGSNSGAYL